MASRDSDVHTIRCRLLWYHRDVGYDPTVIHADTNNLL
jgi:hypothetical protein